jgi:preprotein translocase subunit SecG
MNIVLIVLHVFVCVFLIAVVLLQRGRGAEIGAVFGGGASSTVFGSRGAANFLTRLTTISAVLFMVTSLGLSYLWTHEATERLFSDPAAAVQAPAAAEKPIFEEVGQAPAAGEGAPAAEGAPAPAAAQTPAAAAPPAAAPEAEAPVKTPPPQP